MNTIHCPFCGSEKTDTVVGDDAGEIDGVLCESCDAIFPVDPWTFNKRPIEWQMAKMLFDQLTDSEFVKTDRYGSIEPLEKDEIFDYLRRMGFIVRHESHPLLWRLKNESFST